MIHSSDAGQGGPVATGAMRDFSRMSTVPAHTTRRVTGRQRLVIILGLLLALGFLASTLVSYFVSKNEIQRAIVENELPLTSDTIYSEIQKDLVRPVFVSSVMAGDTFVRDWVIHGERDVPAMTKFLAEMRTRYGTFTSFFVSEGTRNYYHPEGILRRVSKDDPADGWYFRSRDIEAPYEINVDRDTSSPDTLTVFVNYRVFDYAGNLVGVTGVGLTVNTVRRLLSGYQQRYHRGVYFVNRTGEIVLFGDKPAHGSMQIGEVEGLGDIAHTVLNSDSGSYRYRDSGRDYLLNVRYVPELDWYLFVEKVEDEALAGIRRTLYLNLVICALVTAGVLWLSSLTLARYQRRLEQMATTDRLTGLLNRHAFEIILDQTVADVRRTQRPASVVLMDIDHFKALNDRHGHLTGDRMIEHVAGLIRSGLRASDLACRWGGEEFLVVLKDCGIEDALERAESLRVLLSANPLPFSAAPLAVTVSAGVACFRTGDTPETLVNRADHALYEAKRAGRDRVMQG